MKISHILALLVTAILPIAALAANESKSAGKDPMSAELSKWNGAEFEAAYLAMMIHHHQDGVKMAEMVPNKAKSDKLKQMGKKIVADQEKEIGQMTGWLKQWHNKAPDAHKMPAESMKMMQDHMSQLQNAQGEEFDKTFAKLMAQHHEGAISMAQLAEDKAQHKEVKDMAKKIISSQTEERQQLLKMGGSSSGTFGGDGATETRRRSKRDRVEAKTVDPQ